MKKKIIGACMTKINDRTRAEYISLLKKYAAKRGFKLVVFNSVIDFYNNDNFDVGAESVYSYMNFDLLDAIIVFAEHFCNKNVVDRIIERAKKSNTPVVVIGAEYEGCFSVTRGYHDVFTALMDHVINVHGAKDTFFIAGSNDAESAHRIDCYKEALEKNGLCFSSENVGYGEYWDLPTKAVVEELLLREKLPDAVFCANDYMAIAACEKFAEAGVRVPEDVIVTGFDGIPDADYYIPRLTTCKEDAEAIAERVIEIVDQALRGAEEYVCGGITYTNCFSDSCGCSEAKTEKHDVRYLFHKAQETEAHEAYILAWIDRICESTSFSQLCGSLEKCIIPDSCICITSEYITAVVDDSYISSADMSVVSSIHNDDLPSTMNRQAMIPNMNEWMKDDSLYVISSIYVGSLPCGYYGAWVDDITVCASHISRIVKSINICFNFFSNFMKQLHIRRNFDQAALRNSISNLPNLSGADTWFEEFGSVAENHDMALTVSIYSLPKYRYVLENYGVADIENVVKVVANALIKANTDNCYVAHISDDEFVIINYYKDGNLISDIINKATTLFFRYIEEYNNSSDKEYYIEVNCGCTVVNPGWKGSLVGFTKLATAEMYVNRLKSGIGYALKDETPSKDYYRAFNALIDGNLFVYHFQPIVNARNGEIYAFEALMRTDASIGMNPTQVLETAESYKRLYEIERATLFNIMERFDGDFDKFNGHKVFINSIPGHFLNEADAQIICEKYSKYMSYFVFEITEQDTISEDELNMIRRIGNNVNYNQIAIDDYGTGHSNIVNLLRYTPQIIKIDRFLITDIQNDTNKQMFVRSTVDFARMNNIKVLAEGVETSDELKTVIRFGVDYIQGFYTGKPQLDPIAEILPEIKQEIVDANR